MLSHQPFHERQQSPIQGTTVPIGTVSLLKFEFHEWQQSPIQGTVSSIPSDESHLEIVTDALLDAIDRLTFAHHILENTGLDKSHTGLFTAVCDALNGTNEAIERSSDSPDEAPISDTELEALNPFGDLTHE